MANTYYAGTAELGNFLGLTSTDLSALDVTSTMLQDALNRAAAEIDQRTKTHFASGTVTPDYVAISNEKHNGQGKYNREYYTISYPLPSISANVSGTAVANDTIVYVDDASKFPASGIVGIDADKVTYTGKTGTALTGVTGITATHAIGADVLPYVVEISTDDPGASPTWQIMNPDTQFDIDIDTGRVHLYKNNIISSIATTDNPPNYTPNRVRFSYLYGWMPDSDGNVPVEIKKLTLMIASRDLMHTIVMKSHMRGFNNFEPGMINVNDAQIEEYIKRFQNPLFGNI